MSEYKELIGKQAPPISLPDADGNVFNLVPGEKGIPIALFFYPQSGSYGCTKEVCTFRDAIAEKDIWKGDKVQVIGISADDVEKQKAFVAKQKLTYPILSDVKGEASGAYGIGKALFGLSSARVTFMIDGKGVLRDALDAFMNIGAHTKFVTAWLERLEAEGKQAGGAAPPAPQDETPAETPSTSA